ncbi:hypothetical protein MSG28_012761 [Choristoneura fumiferana]|uniref:Uncharacterized protein n=1 Tax=Choristoneura fumiferana TaxID=7141 RepID=A0ACC0JIP7_CHOFU|nr:hypothetical protein MSG28_012761 [Choristoneura fumiferana]
MPSERKLIKILKECAASLEKGHNRHRRRRRRSRSRSRSRPRGGRSRSRSPVRREPSPPPESPPRIETEQKEDESDKVEDAVMVNPFSEALGDDYIETTKYDKSIHEDISRRWTHIIVNGLSKEQRDNITKKYKIPGNCTILEAPAINIEIKNVLGDSSKLRDKSIEIGQAQLGLATGIIGKAMTQLMENEELNKTHLISLLSDASKLLNDLNFHQTKTRKKLIIPSLDKNFIQTIEKSNRNAFLFGDDLSETIKTAKTLQQSMAHIKKTVTPSTKTTKSGNRNGPPLRPKGKGMTRGGPKTQEFQSTQSFHPVNQQKRYSSNQNQRRPAKPAQRPRSAAYRR